MARALLCHTRVVHRVAHILRKFDPSEWGGTETHVAEITLRMQRLGFQSEVFAPSGPVGQRGLDPAVPLRRYGTFCPFIGPRERRRALVAAAGNIVSLSLVARLALDRGIALAHLHTANRIGGAVRTAMLLTGRPYVVSVHGPLLAEPHLVAAETARRLAGLTDLGRPFGLLLGARRVIDDAARVITFNDDEHRALSARIAARAVRMDHGVDAARLGSGSIARAEERWPELGRAPVTALLGRIAAQKNQLLAVRAFAKGAPPDHRLALAGAETDPGYRGRVADEARALGVADRVHFLGNLDRERAVPDLLARASLVLVPSTHEAFGLAVLEAWAASRPVLFAGVSGLRDLARAVGAGPPAVETSDVEAWASMLRRYLASRELRDVASAAGHRLVKLRFSWDAAAARLGSLYEEVLDERRHAHRSRADLGAARGT